MQEEADPNLFIRNILSHFEQDQVETTRHILQQIESHKQDSLNLLRTLNLLLNSKALPSRQRRDMAAIARLVADSNILTTLQGHIREQAKLQSICKVDGYYLQTIKLIGSICWQNPHFIDNILTSSPKIIDLLFDLLKDQQTVPPNEQALINIINFMHSISLKQGPIRDQKLAEVFTTFIKNIFTKDKFFECLQSKKLSSIFSTIQKFHSNVKNIDKFTYNALIQSIIKVNEVYKQICTEFENRQKTSNAVIEIKKSIKLNDRKLVALLKLEQKSRANLFEHIDPFRFVIYLEIIMKIAINRRYVLVETAYENKILINSIAQVIRAIREWKEHLDLNHPEVDEVVREEKQKIEPSPSSPDLQSEMVDQSKQNNKEGSFHLITTQRFSTRTKDQMAKFQGITAVITTFTQRPNKMIIGAINSIIQANNKLQQQKTQQQDPANEEGNYEIFRIQQEGSRLDRVLSLFMKLMDDKQLMKKDYYKTLVSKLYEIFPIFTKKGHSTQIKTVRDLLPEMNWFTTQSDLSCNRFLYKKIDEDHFKSQLHLKITANPSSYHLISDTILRFCLYLTDYKEFLQHCTSEFLHKTLLFYRNNYLAQIKKKEKLSLEDIEQLRSIVRTVSQVFPNNIRSCRDEISRLKLYYYCILVRKNNYEINLFEFLAEVLHALDKYNPSSTEEIQDSVQNRQEVTKTIFYKLITHRLKLLFSMITNYFEDLRKMSSPRHIHTPLGQEQIERDLMFTGNIAYVECMQQFLKLLILQKGNPRQNSLKEQIVGLLLMKTYDFRNFDVYDQDPEIQNREKQYRQDQVRKYNIFIEQKCQSLFSWAVANSGFIIYKLPMLIKKILHFQKEQYIFQSLKKSDNQVQIQYATQCFLKVSQMISQSYFLIEGSYLDLGIKINKKKRRQSQIPQEFDLRNQVIKLANACIIIGEFMCQYNASGLAQKSINTIPQNYITSLISFSRLYMSEFAAQEHFPDEANYLIKATLWLIENYLAYKSVLVEQKQKRIKKKRQQSKKRRRNRVSKKKENIKKSKAKKKSKKLYKENKSIDRNQSNNLESNISKNPSENGKGKQRKSTKKRKLREKQSNDSKTHLKHSTKTNNLQSQENAQTQKSKRGKAKKDTSNFQNKVQDYIKTILILSNKGEKPFLKNLTLQYIIKIISSNVKKNVLSRPPFKYFQLKMSDFISQLLKVVLAEKTIVGYQLLLSRIGLKLVNEEHMRVDFQTGIKRFFYDYSGQKIGYIQFMTFLQTNFQRAPNLSHILQILYKQPATEAENTIPFTYQNTQAIEQTGKRKHCLVRIKQNVQLSMITVSNKNEKKAGNAKEQEKKDKTIKLSDYVPDGQIHLYIYEMINYAIETMILQIDRSMEHLKTKDVGRIQQTRIGQTIPAFNAKIIVNTLQFMIRQSPTLAPWIAKFKCKKIILNSLKNEKIVNKQELSKYVFTLLNKYDEQTQTIAEIGFLQVLIRLFSPFLLNSISGIILQLCFDSTPLVSNSKNNNQGQQQKQKYISFGSVVRQKVVSELDSILFGGNPLDHIFRKAAALNSLSVLINIKQMGRLLIECNFTGKIYNEYLKIVKQYANNSSNKQTFLMPGLYVHKIYTPFFLQILSVLQELNISFHHNKKLIKNQQKTMLDSLILNEQSINSQLVPMDVFKKTKFRTQWPLGKQPQKKENRNEQRFFPDQSDSDSFYREHGEHDSYTEQSSESEESDSVQSDILEERFAELQRMDQEDSYMSLQEGNHSHLLSDQWDYSNQSEMQHQQRMMQEEMQRQLIQNELQNQALEQDEDNQDIDQIQELSQGQMQQLQEGGIQIDDQSEENEQLDSLQDEESDFVSSFMSMSDQDDIQQTAFSPRQQLLFKHKEQQEFFQSATDIINFEKINVVPRISKMQVFQIINLRFFLQLYSYPQRLYQNSVSKRKIGVGELNYQRKIKESLTLLQAFSKDHQLALSHKVEWNQVYRYEHLLKRHPLCESVLSKIFTDQHQVGVSRIRRRNAVLHRNGLIQIFQGPFHAERQDYVHQPIHPPRRVGFGFIQAESESNHNPPASENNDQNIAAADLINEVAQLQSQSENIVQSVIEQQQEQQMPEQQIILRDDYQLGNNQAIEQILRQLNMNMTPQQFQMLSAEIQNDIIQNYYMVNDERALHNIHRELHNLPIEQPVGDIPQRLDLRAGRVMQEEMSPRIAGWNPPVQQIESQSVDVQNEVGQGLQDEYRKMSMEHTMKVNKDIMQTINKNGKNNNKFYQVQDEQFQKIMNIIFELDQKQFKNYPYSLIQTCCINTVNLERIVSTLIALLYLYNDRIEQEKQDNYARRYFSALKIQMEETDKEAVKPKLTLKILYLMSHLTNNYSIAMSFLKVNKTVPKQLEDCLQQTQEYRTSLQMLIMLLDQSYIYKNGQLLKFLISVIENITINHFYKSINALVQSNKDANTAQDVYINQPIKISQQASRLLCNLLQSNYAKEYLHGLSRIIMRLSINESNLALFIKYMQNIVEQLSNACLSEIQKIISSKSNQVEVNSQKQYLKIVNLMNIFFEMVISFKTYPTTPEKHEAVLKDLRKIVEMEVLQTICEKAAFYLFKSQDQKVQMIMGEILEIYFILYEIALATSDFSQQIKPEDLSHKHIAGLGHIKQLRKMHKSNQLKKQEDLILGKFNLSKLWKQSISQPVFKTYINNCIKKKLNNYNQQHTNLNQSIFDVPIFKVAISTPHMLSFDNKRLIFKNELKRLRKKSKYHMVHMVLRREEVFEDSFTEIMHYESSVLKGKLKIEFKEQQGEDAGGITREWFQLLSKKMFDPNYALFKSGSTGNTFHPSPQSYINSLHLKYFKFIGRIIGKALYDGYLLDAYFTPAFYKHILNLPITYLDMEQQDYEYFKSLKWILDNSPIQDFLQLNFTYSFDNFGQIQMKELIPGGADILVTEQNKLEYVQLSSYAKMATSIKHQLEALLEGFHQLIPHKLIKIFNEKELEIMISGRPSIDIQDLKRNTELVNYIKNDQIITWLFEVLESFDMELRTAFLQFVTGSSRVPVEGFKDLRGMNGVQKFNIHKEFQQQRLPRAHTCFNQLDLPNYKTKEILIEKLMLAITEGKEGFHMI